MSSVFGATSTQVSAVGRMRSRPPLSRFDLLSGLRLYLDQGQFDNAETFVTEALEVSRRVLGKEHSDTLTSLDHLGQLSVKQKMYVEAEALLRECLATREVKHPDRWEAFRTRSLLGSALLGQKKFADAEPFILEGYAGLKQRADKIPYDERSILPDAIQRAVDLYTQWNRPAYAEKWQQLLPTHSVK